MVIDKVHCLFEQSGTFKNEFKKLGIDAYDYDILNNYGQTDFQMDLFSEIEGGYEGKMSIFDKITEKDLIMAFFPCVRFEDQIMLHFKGQAKQMINKTDKEKMMYCMKLLKETKHNYDLVNKLFIICIDKGLRLIMENPYSEQHFLRRYWCLQPTIIDRDRRQNGDYYKKPTQYWFLNCKPEGSILFEPLEYNAVPCKNAITSMKKEDYEHFATTASEARSMIHPTYANRFIRSQILGNGGGEEWLRGKPESSH